MITELILMGLISLGHLLLLLLPKFTLMLPENLIDSVINFFSGIGYFLPIKSISLILSLQLAYLVFKFVYNMITEMKEWTPGI